VKILLDTSVLLWVATMPERVSREVRAAIQDGDNDVFVSSVTAWEIAIKQSIGKLELAMPAEDWLPLVIRRTGFSTAPVTLDAALRVRALPWHHRDPFDRLLVAQALEMQCAIATGDEAFEKYGVLLLQT
jgi:PIN domain nuclease of toxin-antitoxin system